MNNVCINSVSLVRPYISEIDMLNSIFYNSFCPAFVAADGPGRMVAIYYLLRELCQSFATKKMLALCALASMNSILRYRCLCKKEDIVLRPFHERYMKYVKNRKIIVFMNTLHSLYYTGVPNKNPCFYVILME